MTIDNKLQELEKLFALFLTEYPPTTDGRRHIEGYQVCRDAGRQNYQLVKAADGRGEDVTDLVLRKLLPHSNTKNNREAGAWIHIAPAITSDIRVWFERASWTKPENWPSVSKAILAFVKKCMDSPEDLPSACEEFVSLPYTTGLQTGMITPILNALNPDAYTMVNNKPRRVINHFTGQSFPQSLRGYPELNQAIKSFVATNDVFQQEAVKLGMLPNDLFDMFSHWLVAVKRYFKEDPIVEEEEMDTMKLADPFSRIFRNYEEADWALDVFQDALLRAGFNDPHDPRFATTLPAGGNPKLRIILGNWLLIGYIGRTNDTVMQIALTTESAKNLEYDASDPFARQSDESECRLYSRIPISDFKSNQELIEAYQKSMPVIGALFGRWRKSLQHGIHVPQIAEAIFDPSKREALLTKGLQQKDIPQENPRYTLAECAKDTGFSAQELNRWLKAIERKKQAIIYGPPGTGKTFVAQALAKLLTTGGDGFVEIVQFHPAYSYEDFIQGIRPRTSVDHTLVYEMTRGRFLSFCDEAATRSSTCVMIVDEINRANLSRVFGELMYLMEYRNQVIRLASGEEFSIPENVRILGTMNTADRSIALVDHALRRRFAFLELFPNFDVLKSYHKATKLNVNGLVEQLELLNKNIENPHYSVGISYFMRPDLASHLEDIWKTEIEPYLNEYFFDKPQRAEQFRWEKIRDKIAL